MAPWLKTLQHLSVSVPLPHLPSSSCSSRRTLFLHTYQARSHLRPFALAVPSAGHSPSPLHLSSDMPPSQGPPLPTRFGRPAGLKAPLQHLHLWEINKFISLLTNLPQNINCMGGKDSVCAAHHKLPAQTVSGPTRDSHPPPRAARLLEQLLPDSSNPPDPRGGCGLAEHSARSPVTGRNCMPGQGLQGGAPESSRSQKVNLQEVHGRGWALTTIPKCHVLLRGLVLSQSVNKPSGGHTP